MSSQIGPAGYATAMHLLSKKCLETLDHLEITGKAYDTWKQMSATLEQLAGEPSPEDAELLREVADLLIDEADNLEAGDLDEDDDFLDDEDDAEE